MTPLHEAAQLEDVEMVKLLIEHRAILDDQNNVRIPLLIVLQL